MSISLISTSSLDLAEKNRKYFFADFAQVNIKKNNEGFHSLKDVVEQVK